MAEYTSAQLAQMDRETLAVAALIEVCGRNDVGATLEGYGWVAVGEVVEAMLYDGWHVSIDGMGNRAEAEIYDPADERTIQAKASEAPTALFVAAILAVQSPSQH